MADFFFVVRAFLVTLVIFILLQIKVGSRTVEQHSLAWIHQSSVIGTLHDVASSAIEVGHRGYNKVSGWFGGHSTAGASSRAISHSRRTESRRASAGERAAASDDRTDDTADSDSTHSSYRSFFEVKTVHEPNAD